MSSLDRTFELPAGALESHGGASIDDRTREILAHRRRTPVLKSRGWLVRRLLLAADTIGLIIGFTFSEILFENGLFGPWVEYAVFVGSLPIWMFGAKLFGLYDRDEERTDHSTADDLVRVFLLVTVGAFLFTRVDLVTDLIDPDLTKLTFFWGAAIALITLGRIVARTVSRQSIAYMQNTIIVGAGDIGQLVARKLLHHPEYGINLVGFVDDAPKERREDLGDLALLGPLDALPKLVELLDVDRIIIAFSNDSPEEILTLLRSLRDTVQIDIVPRLFELVGPKVDMHTVEGLPLVGLPPVRLSRSSKLLKRAFDVTLAGLALFLTAPLLAYVALRIKRDSPGPVFFRQRRLGLNMREFTLLKFRTMRVGTPEDAHRAYIRATMSKDALPESTGLFKLDRDDAVTRVGRWLRRTSLDELPQLINVIRGDMSLVGPRPCLPYEVEGFAPHHYDRFLVPAGITGLWQVTARAHSTFGEALDMDVAYARGWSLGLDLKLIGRTPLQLLRPKVTH